MTLKELKLLIRKAATIYYTGEWEGQKYDNPIMSDAQFDQYVAWLRSLDPSAAEVNKTGWGYEPSSVSGDKVRHLHGGMDSIDNKPRDMESIPQRLLSNVRISSKLDGLSGKIEFVDGKFTRCVTRGNGEVGIDKTDKFQYILDRLGGCSVPDDFTGEVRGEFVISQANWQKMLEAGSDKSHPRNAASGLIGADEISEDMKYLDFIPYKVIWDKHGTAPVSANVTENECFLCSWFSNFPSLPKTFYLSGSSYTADDLADMYNGWSQFWPMDGLVITSLNVNKAADGVYLYDEVAYKFDSLKKVTTIKSIDWQMSKFSKLTPVANLEPVDIDGALISRVTLNNAEFVQSNCLCTGAEVEIMRSGGVIPYLTQVVSIPEGAVPEIPEVCPICGMDLHRQGVNVVCVNELCGNVDSQNLRVWMKTLGETDGLADTLISEYVYRFKLTSISELYKAVSEKRFEDLKIEGVQSNKFYSMITKLAESPVELKAYLLALNIPRLGDVTAKKLASHSSFTALIKELVEGKEADSAVWYQVISALAGEATAKSIIDNIGKFNTIQYVGNRLIIPTSTTTESGSEPIHVCITGTLSRPRKMLVTMLEAAGYVVKEDVTKKTKYLITNEVNGSSGKHKRANELGTEKVTEDFIFDLINA